MKCILVIEDDEAIGEALSMALGIDGIYRVEMINKPENISEQVRKLHPDLILLDLLLFGTDGREIARELKAENDLRQIPIIMMSAHPNIEKSAQEGGADDFISKPFSIDGLMKKVEKWSGVSMLL